jgi:hypothetical protein
MTHINNNVNITNNVNNNNNVNNSNNVNNNNNVLNWATNKYMDSVTVIVAYRRVQ